MPCFTTLDAFKYQSSSTTEYKSMTYLLLLIIITPDEIFSCICIKRKINTVHIQSTCSEQITIYTYVYIVLSILLNKLLYIHMYV